MSTDTMAGVTMAGVTEYAHMLLKVSDIKRSERFYVDLLGFKVRPAKPLPVTSRLQWNYARPAASMRLPPLQLTSAHCFLVATVFPDTQSSWPTLQAPKSMRWPLWPRTCA